MNRIVVVIPTYNERGNITELINRIDAERTKISGDLHILIVDDNSPDGTAQLIEELQSDFENLHLIKGTKEGLGRAYLRGFEFALSMLEADIVVQMDGDLSHNPAYLPELIEKIEDGADFVIGSRYVKGGGVPKTWPLMRKLNSRVANIVSKTIGGIRGIKDATGGFRAIRSHLLRRLPLENMGVDGYAIQIGLIHYAQEAGAKFSEVPIQFQDRTDGESKLRLKDVLEFITVSLNFRFAALSSGFSTLAIIALMVIPLIISVALAVLEPAQALAIAVFTISSYMLLQSVANIVSLTFAWSNPQIVAQNQSPKKFLAPAVSFTALIPARFEEAVIADTIRAVDSINYPDSLKEILIICRNDDRGTIKKARETIRALNKRNIKVVVFNDEQVNKPHALNVGLSKATKDVVVIFDAEDQPHPDIFNIANTNYISDDVDVLQAGVQLINYRSRWFSLLNVLEYYFWFKSSLHLFSKFKVVPLGGNTVFFRKSALYEVGGWDEACLTEDADIGLRLSARNARFKVTYDALHATQEETPHNVSGFIKQRTRWNQGFLQILLKGDWLRLPSLTQKMLALYALLMPHILGVQFIIIPLSIYVAIAFDLPVVIALFSIVPLFMLAFQMVIYSLGFFSFTREYGFKFYLTDPLKIALWFYPYSLMLGASSLRGFFRLLFAQTSWEKTVHLNEHRATNQLDLEVQYATQTGA